MRHLLAAILTLLLAACATSTQAHVENTATARNDSVQWEADITAFEQIDSVVRRKPGGIVFTGSSSIRLWHSLPDAFTEAAIINRGFGGSRVRDVTHYADRIVTHYRPRAVAIYAGDNDLAEGRTAQQVHDDFVAFVRHVHATSPHARIGYIAIKPSPARKALQPQMRQANRLIEAYAAAHDQVDYLDVYTPMLDSTGEPRPELFLPDMLHMNDSGYALWTNVVGPWLRVLPDPVPPSR